jgi:hypothetical protein
MGFSAGRDTVDKTGEHAARSTMITGIFDGIHKRLSDPEDSRMSNFRLARQNQADLSL